MKQSKPWFLLLAVVLAACGTNSADVVPPTDSSGPGDVRLDAGSSDAADDIASDLGPVDDASVSADVSVDAGEPPPPDPAFVFEVTERGSCVPDAPFTQDRTEMVRTADVLAELDTRAVFASETTVWVGTPSGLFLRSGEEAAFTRVAAETITEGVVALAPSPGGVLVASGAHLYELDASGQVVSDVPVGEPVAVVGACAGATYLVFGGSLYVVDEAAAASVDGSPALVTALACDDGKLLVAAADGLWRDEETGWQRLWNPEPAAVVDVAAAGGRIVAATADSVFVREADGTSAVHTPGLEALPTDGIVAVAARAGGADWATGHVVGATTRRADIPGYEHFVSHRWLPDNAVRDVAFATDGSLWVATAGGLARLYKEPTTLAAKAERMFATLDSWFWRLNGFVSVGGNFGDPWDPQPPMLRDDDNDGQWTEEAIAAFCYAYAVTGDERYYDAARKAVDNMMLLFDVPAHDFEAAGLGRGFVSRSVVRDDEGAIFADKSSQSNWHLVEHDDGHEYYWKDDTSSDETTGHFYGLAVFYDLCAKTDQEKAEVAERLGSLAGTILDNDYLLVDIDGEPTTHGYWGPDRLAIFLDGLTACAQEHNPVDCADAWGGGGYLNSLEMLAGLLSAWHQTGDERFYEAYDTLITEHRYDEVATFHDSVVTWTEPVFRNTCDHELADLAFLTLLRYERDPERRAHWIAQMLAGWEYEHLERNPLKTLAMAAAMEQPPGVDLGMRTLREYPEDMRDVLVDNAHRLDVTRNGNDRHGTPQFAQALPYDEIHTVRWDSNPFAVSGGGNGSYWRVTTFWLLPYWGLRYHGVICAPENDSAR